MPPTAVSCGLVYFNLAKQFTLHRETSTRHGHNMPARMADVNVDDLDHSANSEADDCRRLGSVGRVISNSVAYVHPSSLRSTRDLEIRQRLAGSDCIVQPAGALAAATPGIAGVVAIHGGDLVLREEVAHQITGVGQDLVDRRCLIDRPAISKRLLHEHRCHCR